MEEIIKNLYKYLTCNRFLNPKEEMEIIQNMKDLETLLYQEGKTELADKIADVMDNYYPYDSVCEILDEKTGVFCNGKALIKTSKTIKKNYDSMSSYLYFKKINHSDYLISECTRKPKRFFVGNYWYVFVMADVHEIRKFIRETLFDIHNVSEAMRKVIKDMYVEQCYQLLGRMQSDCKYFLSLPGFNEDCLWGKSVTQHIADMKELYNSLLVKPKFLHMYDIEEYEKRMKEKLEKEVQDVLYSD